LKRGDGVFGLVEGREEIEQAHHFQSLNRKFGWFEKADGAPGLLSGGEMPDEHADAARINGRDFFQIEDDAILSLAEEFGHGRIEAIERGSHAQAATKFDELDAIQSFRLDIQVTCLHDHEILRPLRVDSRKGLC